MFRSILCREVIFTCSEILGTHKNVLRGPSVECFEGHVKYLLVLKGF
jgi:hypothetical protein